MQKKPNILILMTDQQRADCYGAAGNTKIRTPNMDWLANEGLRFKQATTVCPLCMPARASFINGLYPHNHGMWDNEGKMPADDETFFRHIQADGYFTAHIGKSHYYIHESNLHMRDREDYMHARGLEYVHETTGPLATQHTESYMTDDWKEKGLLDIFKEDYKERIYQHKGWYARQSPLPVDDFMDSYVGKKAVEFIESYDDPRQMCLFVGFPGPHHPWDAPGEYASMYDPIEMPEAIGIPPQNSNLPDFVGKKSDLKYSPDMTAQDIQKMRANYYGKISLIDYWFGRILDAYDIRGLLDDLFIIFISDHGEMLGDHGRISKCIFKESSVRIPLVIRWPGRIPAGSASDALVENIDVFPTILEAVGIKQSARCLGKSLWPAINKPDGDFRESQLSEIFYEDSRNVMLRTSKYKYVVDDQGYGFMFYDLANDPEEQNNLIGQECAAAEEHEIRDELFKRILAAQYVMESK